MMCVPNRARSATRVKREASQTAVVNALVAQDITFEHIKSHPRALEIFFREILSLCKMRERKFGETKESESRLEFLDIIHSASLFCFLVAISRVDRVLSIVIL